MTVLLDHSVQFTLGNDLICNPLQYALAENCSTDFVRFLVERGADINSSLMVSEGSCNIGIPAYVHFAKPVAVIQSPVITIVI